MTETADWELWKKGMNHIVHRKSLVSKSNLCYAKTFGWTVQGIDQALIS
jgi:hypothetical protein